MGHRPVITVLLFLAGAAFAAADVVITDATNVTLAGVQRGSDANSEEIPDVTGGGRNLVEYTEVSANDYAAAGGRTRPFGPHNLNDGDVGPGRPTDGAHAIPSFGVDAVVIAFGRVAELDGIAIYHGYGNREQARFVLRDQAGALLGAWTSTSFEQTTHAYWLRFVDPVRSSGLVLEAYAVGPHSTTPSFREIQVLATPSDGARRFAAAELRLLGLQAGGLPLALFVGAGDATAERQRDAVVAALSSAADALGSAGDREAVRELATLLPRLAGRPEGPYAMLASAERVRLAGGVVRMIVLVGTL